LRGVHAVEQIWPGAVLLGNAAHTFHPVAAQGFNLSIRDVAALAEIITEGLASKQKLGALSLLNKYAAWRESEQALTIKCTHSLAALFSTQAFPLVVGRHAGLAALDILTPAKTYLAKRAMGKVWRGMHLD
jgi:2-octaprenyl-6-methoxyphenol hydroxylase